jgi:hypothetical protein
MILRACRGSLTIITMNTVLSQSLEGLSEEKIHIVSSVFDHAAKLLDVSPRFRFFTLHGREHLLNLFRLLGIFRKGGLTFSDHELFILALAICTHDLGMVTPLRDTELSELFEGKPSYPDPAYVENFIRETHHQRIDTYFANELGFLLALGLSISQLDLVRQIGQAHRKVELRQLSYATRYLGAVMRLLDELDVTPERAPATVLRNIWNELDPTSCWHWFKHNITAGWTEGHNVHFETFNTRKRILFNIVVNPPRSRSIGYWLHQVRRPILKALQDEEAGQIVKDHCGVEICVRKDNDESRELSLTSEWADIEEKALSANRRTIMLIDDESRKMDDLFVPCMDYFHVIFSPNAKDALEKMQAAPVDLAVIDMQVSSGNIWLANETNDFKSTGIKLCQEISKRFPNTRLAILTGTRHPFVIPKELSIAFVARKPIDPDQLLERINGVLS